MFREIYSRLGILVVLIIVCIVLTFVSPYFLQTRNLINILLQASIITIVGVGMTFVILTGGIDLSVGSLVALCIVTTASINKMVYAAHQFDSVSKFLLGIILPIIAAVIVGALAGSFNGFMIAKGNVPAFIMTFGTMSIARGIAYMITKNETLSVFPDELTLLGGGKIAGLIPIPVIVAITLVLIAAWILKYTKFGRYVYAIGGNREAARLSGINVTLITIMVYVISGVTCAIASTILLGRLKVAQPIAGMGYELDAIAAVIIGGTSIFGGEGNVIGTLLGALLLATIRNGLNLLNVLPNYQLLVIGFTIVGAVYYDNKARSGVKAS